MFQTGVFKVMGRSNDLEAGVLDLRGKKSPPKAQHPNCIQLSDITIFTYAGLECIHQIIFKTSKSNG